ncbi:hypothetical protein [Kitasatospora camelliae]|uniref:Integral membrane protein n=1 Tax=Kitasatospora camelliae TaxID=3156397 RepID=A0AAU8JX26_9ACTN
MGDRMLRAALRCYPAGYRRERADEIAEVYAGTTAGAGRVARLWELAGIAGYGLRVRTGLTSAGTPGRLLAEAAPMVLAVVLGLVLPYLIGLGLHPRLTVRRFSPASLPFLLSLGSVVPAAVAALAGRWTVARALAVVAGAGWVAVVVHDAWWILSRPRIYDGSLLIDIALELFPVLWAVLLVAAPPDLLGRVAWRRLGVAALLTGAVAVLQWTGGLYLISPEGAALAAVVAALALLPAVYGRLLPAAISLAALPPLLTASVWYLHLWLPGLRLLALVLVAALAASVVAVRLALYLRRRPTVPPAAG